MDHLQAVSQGLILTVFVTLSSFFLGSLGAIPLFFMRRSRFAVVRAASRTMVEVLRGIPPVVWLFIVFFGIGGSFVALVPTSAAIVGLSLITAAYMSEIYRAGISGIDQGQWEAAQSVRLSSWATWIDVIGPQFVRISLPAATTWLIGLLKDSSIASTIGVMELTFYAKSDAGQTASPLVPFVWTGVLYVILTVPLAIASRTADSKLRKRVAR